MRGAGDPAADCERECHCRVASRPPRRVRPGFLRERLCMAGSVRRRPYLRHRRFPKPSRDGQSLRKLARGALKMYGAASGPVRTPPRWGDWSVTAIGIPASAGAARTPSFAARIEIARSQSFRVRSATCRRHGGLSLAGDGRIRHAARLVTHDGARKEDTAKLATRGVTLVRPVGFEPTTYSSGGCRSIHLSRAFSLEEQKTLRRVALNR